MTAVVIVGGYSRRVLLNWLTGWSWSLTLLVNQAVGPLIGMAIWTQVTGGRTEIVTYYAALLVVGRFTTGYAGHTFSGTIYNGELTDALLRPHPVLLGQLGWYFGVTAFDLLFVAPVIVALGVFTSASVSLVGVALAVPVVVLAAAGAFAFDFALACSAFWTQRYFAATEAGARLAFLFGGVAVPIALLPDAVGPWFALMPFRWIRGFPAELAAGLVPQGDILDAFALQLAWTGVLAGMAAFVYRAGIRRYTAIGG